MIPRKVIFPLLNFLLKSAHFPFPFWLNTIYLKVRWNACYAAGGVLKPSSIFEEKQLMSKRFLLIETLLPIVENFPNFKVRNPKKVLLNK